MTMLAAMLGSSVSACSSVETAKCTPGQSVSCGDPHGCVGNQVCNADGASFAACVCDTQQTTSNGSSSGHGGAGGGPIATSSSSSAGGSGGQANFTPASLPGLVLWLDDDHGVIADTQHPGTLLRWLDQSGLGNDAEAMGLQDPYRFVIDPAVLHGHDAFVCPGNGTRIEVPDVPSLRFGTGQYGIAMVVRRSSYQSGVFQSFYEKDSADGGVVIGYNSDFELHQGTSMALVADPKPSAFHIVIARGPALELNLDGSLGLGTTQTNNVDGVAWPVFLCLKGLADGQEIAEVVAVKGPLSDADAAQLRSYLETKFSL